MRWCEGKEEGEVVVGGNGERNQLNLPSSLSFDDEENLYVVDYFNHQVQKMGRKNESGRKNEVSNPSSLVDQYRKQLGRQEKKVVGERRKEIKRLMSEKETVSYWKKIIMALGAVLCLIFILYISFAYYLAPKDSF
ncbi:unnamed protein product [Adineta steineri]|uniref:Uncharacterized protein n=2 Tax=Adineta steineri TaxID=433720 RepID=A0A814F4Z9_9BILA|nr:unnamed protein product [Adineta steineri]